MLQPGGERRLVPEVARQVHDPHARVGVGDAVEELGRAVGRAVVDEHQLERIVGDRGDRAGDELLDQLLLVVDRRDDAEQRGGAQCVWSGMIVSPVGVGADTASSSISAERPKPQLELSFILCTHAFRDDEPQARSPGVALPPGG